MVQKIVDACDKTNWDEQALHLLGLAQPHLISGALRGVWLGDELTASGVGSHPHVPGALSFRDLEKYINLVRGFLDAHVAPARAASAAYRHPDRPPARRCAPTY